MIEADFNFFPREGLDPLDGGLHSFLDGPPTNYVGTHVVEAGSVASMEAVGGKLGITVEVQKGAGEIYFTTPGSNDGLEVPPDHVLVLVAASDYSQMAGFWRELNTERSNMLNSANT